jgi:chromosome segregation ATPase
MSVDQPEASNNSSFKKETARDLRKRNKRLKNSRDDLKKKSRQQAGDIKALKGKNVDLKESRDLWKEHYYREQEEKNSLEMTLKAEKKRVDEMEAFAQERERLLKIKEKVREEEKAKYEQEIDKLKKKLMKWSN